MSLNPFAALLSDPEPPSPPTPPKETLSSIIEKIFGFTIDPEHISSGKLFLEEVKIVHQKTELDLSLLHYALFERLFMCNENSGLVNNDPTSHAFETRVLNYLYCCYKELNGLRDKLKEEEAAEIGNNILQNVATAVMQPDIYSGQSIPWDMVELLKESEPEVEGFFIDATKQIMKEDGNKREMLYNFIETMNLIVTDELQRTTLETINMNIFNYFSIMLKNETITELFIDSCVPKRVDIGSSYATTPIGALFNISVLPKTPGGKYEYFSHPADQTTINSTNDYLVLCLEKLNTNIHKFFVGLLKSNPSVKNKTLNWLADCMKHNAARGKIWNSHVPDLNPVVYTTVTDGFMINFCILLLKLCRPFCSNIEQGKILKVDPTYSAVPNEKIEEKNVHMKDLAEETCLIPVENNEERPMADNSYSFVTECFFMTHRAFDLSCRVTIDKMMRQSLEMGRMNRAFQDALAQHGRGSDVATALKDRLNAELMKYLSIKCVLTDPELLEMVIEFIAATSYWLSQVAIHTEIDDTSTYAPLTALPVSFPLPEKIPQTLKCIPEFVVDNIVTFLGFVQNFALPPFEMQSFDKLSPIFTCILIFMGSQEHLKNPHVRAKLAEALESLLPYHRNISHSDTNLNVTQRQLLFAEHPHRLHVVENLMKVFVSIEMTGQSVEFEQKFNYRRPMYAVFDYLWKLEEQVECFQRLAQEAERNMESVHPPLFLKFVNLLINDAIFLLDESLTNMAKLKAMQQAHDNGEWANLSARERTRNLEYMNHVGHLARFDNILGKDTIETLEKLTSRIKNVFTHSTMVDRIAAMLNYFLINLVGPNKKNFKVKDPQEYRFEPAANVMEICKIYIHLADSDAFCLAVSQDGRSYSPNLFSLAEEVLVRIQGGALIAELKEVAAKVAEKARESQANEEALSEAPEHFLDPIMSTIMMDPVILPSSRQTVDRSTIARHLLSDQTDPFNRNPLTMDQVIPNTELAEEIRSWIEKRRQM